MKIKELKIYLEKELKELNEYSLWLYQRRKTYKKLHFEQLYAYASGQKKIIEDVLKLLENIEN